MKFSLIRQQNIQRPILFLGIALVIVFLSNQNAHHTLYTLANSFTWLTGFYFFYQNCFHSRTLLNEKKWVRFFSKNVLIFLVAYVLSAILYLVYLSSLGEGSFQLKHLFMTSYPYRSNIELPILYGLGLIFGRLSKRQVIRTISVTAAIAGIAGLSFSLYNSSFHKKDILGVNILDQTFGSIEEMVALPQFQDKTVYIDLWFSNCTSCIEQMKFHLPNFKRQMSKANIPIEYLYLARETSHPNSEQRWWNAVETYQLKGWHYYFEKEDSERMWKSILPHLKKKGKRAYGYPQYLIAQNGEIIDYDAPYPEEVSTIQNMLTVKK